MLYYFFKNFFYNLEIFFIVFRILFKNEINFAYYLTLIRILTMSAYLPLLLTRIEARRHNPETNNQSRHNPLRIPIFLLRSN